MSISFRWSEKMKRFFCTVLAALCLIPCCCGLSEAAEDPVAVRVGEYTYSKSLVEFTMHTAADQNGIYWELLEQEDKERIRDAVIEQVIGIGLIENILKEKGMHDFSDAEEEIIRMRAQTQYDQAWQNLYRYASESGINVTDAQVSEWMNDRGYTLERFRMSLEAAERQFRVFSLFCDTFTPTEDEIDAYYLEKYVEGDRKKYENNLALYEQEVFIKGNESFYTPAGYRLMKWVVVPYPEDVTRNARPLAVRFSLQETEVMNAYNTLAYAAASVEDFNELKPLREAYDRAGEKLKATEAELMDVLRQALPAAEALKEKIVRRMAEGMTFDHAVRVYDEKQVFADPDNPGTPFHPDSSNWTGNLYTAALSLTEPGQISDPVPVADGMYILYCAGLLPEGAHQLTAQEREMVAQNIVYDAQLRQLMELMETWKQQYAIETDLSRLNLD